MSRTEKASVLLETAKRQRKEMSSLAAEVSAYAPPTIKADLIDLTGKRQKAWTSWIWAPLVVATVIGGLATVIFAT